MEDKDLETNEIGFEFRLLFDGGEEVVGVGLYCIGGDMIGWNCDECWLLLLPLLLLLLL